MRCWFCFSDREVPKLTKEHLLSEPVATAFGIDRSAPFGHVREDLSIAFTRLDDSSVRYVCADCNNTWMNDLEHEMAAVAEWAFARDDALKPKQYDVIRSWGLKTYLTLSVMVGGTRGLMDDPQAPGVIPSVTRARQLYEGDAGAFLGMAFGISRPREKDRFSYAFGNPRVIPQGPGYASVKSAGLAIITLGPIRLWVVDPTIFTQAQTTFPPRVRTLVPGLAIHLLQRLKPAPARLEAVTVNNGEHDIDALIAHLQQFSREQTA